MPRDWSRTSDSTWEGLQPLKADSYRCGYCSLDVSSDRGLQTASNSAFIRVCPHCNAPTFFSHVNEQWPGPKVGRTVEKLPDDVAALHEEARGAITVNAHTGAVMLCRKVLMHVAVQQGAAPGLTFQHYVKWLIDEHYVPRGSENWLDYIRSRGNEANHEITVIARDDSLGVLRFTEALLQSVYELPSAVPTNTASGSKMAED